MLTDRQTNECGQIHLPPPLSEVIRHLLHVHQQELSYHKQIVRQQHTPHVQGMNSNPVTLKSRLRVTQSHWKWNHWIDHTRLTISQVILRGILS